MKTGVASLYTAGATAVWLLLLVLAIGCGTQQADTQPPSVMAVAFCDPDGSHQTEMRDTLHNPFPHLRFSDSTVSLNDRCPVRKVPLNRRLPAMLVNGRPIGFC